VAGGPDRALPSAAREGGHAALFVVRVAECLVRGLLNFDTATLARLLIPTTSKTTVRFG
jgi:hypothetical protein